MPAKGREHMEDATLFTPHLKPGEQIVWSSAESRAMLKASHDSQRLPRLGLAIVSGIIAIALGYRFAEAAFSWSNQPDLSSAVAAPMYVVFALALAVLAVFSVLRVVRAPPQPVLYAATSQRLLAIDAAGRLTAEIAGADIAGVERMDRPNRTHLLVTARTGAEPSAFSINNIDNAAAVAAMIQTTFPHDTLAETTP
jgi:hypothetical protein